MKTVTRFFALVLLLTLVGCGTADTVSSTVFDESETFSEAETSSKQTTQKEEAKLTDFLLEDGFLDVTAASLEIKAKGGDDSFYFEEMEGVKGYQINGGVYNLDAETLRRLVNVPVRGDARIRWIGYEDCGSWSGNLEQPEFAPANKINDPIFMSMFLPSERRCFLESRNSLLK